MEKNTQIPKGRIVIIGGNEAKEPKSNPSENNHQNVDFSNGVLEQVLKEIGGNPIIEIVPVASEDQDEVGKNYISAFNKLNHKAKALIIKNRKDVDKTETLQRIEEADLVFFSGGDQVKLFKMLHDTQFLKVLRNKYLNDEFIIAGTSSGAMVMGEHMITTGENEEAVIKGIIQTQQGLGIIPNVIIDTHFLSRGRFSRLTEALLICKDDIGLGICEDTGVIISEGKLLRTVGSGTVILMEGNKVMNTNYSVVKEKDAVYIENLIVHVLASGSGFNLEERKFLVMEKKKTLKKEMLEA